MGTLNRVGKSAIFVLNRVRVRGAGPHLPTQGYNERPPRGGGLRICKTVFLLPTPSPANLINDFASLLSPACSHGMGKTGNKSALWVDSPFQQRLLIFCALIFIFRTTQIAEIGTLYPGILCCTIFLFSI